LAAINFRFGFYYTKSCAMRYSAEVFANQLSYVASPSVEEQAAVIPRQDVERSAGRVPSATAQAEAAFKRSRENLVQDPGLASPCFSSSVICGSSGLIFHCAFHRKLLAKMSLLDSLCFLSLRWVVRKLLSVQIARHGPAYPSVPGLIRELPAHTVYSRYT
jgi:hypothetical protein